MAQAQGVKLVGCTMTALIRLQREELIDLPIPVIQINP